MTRIGRPPGTDAPRADGHLAILTSWLQPGESWASLARRIGVSRRNLDNAKRDGITVRKLAEWSERIGRR